MHTSSCVLRNEGVCMLRKIKTLLRHIIFPPVCLTFAFTAKSINYPHRYLGRRVQSTCEKSSGLYSKNDGMSCSATTRTGGSAEASGSVPRSDGFCCRITRAEEAPQAVQTSARLMTGHGCRLNRPERVSVAFGAPRECFLLSLNFWLDTALGEW